MKNNIHEENKKQLWHDYCEWVKTQNYGTIYHYLCGVLNYTMEEAKEIVNELNKL